SISAKCQCSAATWRTAESSFWSAATSLARRNSDSAPGPRSWRICGTRLADLRLPDVAPELQGRALHAPGSPHVRDDAARKRPARRDVGRGAGVQRASADLHVAHRYRAAI